jgi:phospholipase/carboxylesterase
MHERSVVIQLPTDAAQLVLLFHGVGSTAANLAPLGDAIAKALPDAAVVSIDAPLASTLGNGREWFSVLGITEQDRPARIAQALPLFRQAVHHWQRQTGIAVAQTTLIGFSQGAIMSLESTQTGEPSLAARVVSLAGRFATPVRTVPPGLCYHFMHGTHDGVVAPQFAQQASAQIAALGGTATLDMLDDLGHAIDSRESQLLLAYLGQNGR